MRVEAGEHALEAVLHHAVVIDRLDIAGMDAIHHPAVEREIGIAAARQRRAAADKEKDKGRGSGAAKLKDGGHRAITVVAASVKCYAISLRRHMPHGISWRPTWTMQESLLLYKRRRAARPSDRRGITR